ncbi:hypothetical protein T06_4263 [Trichinella sp. T6]|nr:hypothetical protein T06_4263 [Trichinella sp. T6]
MISVLVPISPLTPPTLRKTGAKWRFLYSINVNITCGRRASLNSSASHFPQTPPPFCDWLYSDRLHTIDRRAFNKMSCNIRMCL